MINPQSIDQEKQNKPSYVVRDLAGLVPPQLTYEILLRRGVFKWLSVRRKLIRLKDEWKKEIVALNRKKTPREKGYLQALEKCREEIRALCHDNRWQAPDNDRGAVAFLSSLTKGDKTP